MPEQWRLICDTPARGSFNMAADYALINAVADGSSLPVLRFYAWNPPAATLGYFQEAEDETDAEACRRAGVDIVRRITGGGAVFHDDEITYSIIFSAKHPLAGKTILDSYALILKPFIETLRSYGLNAEHAPVNDIVIDGRKISGSAQTRRGGFVLQHGTILLSMDRAKAFRCLTVPQQKTEEKGLTDPADRIITLKDLLGEQAGTDAFKKEFIQRTVANFTDLYSLAFQPSSLTAGELSAAALAEKSLFSIESWTKHRSKPADE